MTHEAKEAELTQANGCCQGEAAGTDCCDVAERSVTSRNVVTVRPAVDAWTTDGDVWLSADVPGVAADGVEITIERDLLQIEAVATPLAVESPQHREFPQKRYKRVFKLSDQIDRAGIEANVTNGVLRVKLPKAAEAQPIKVSVTAN